MEQGLAAGQPGHFHRRPGAEHPHNVGIHPRQGFQQFDLIAWDAHMAAVNALGFAEFIQAETVDHHIHRSSQIQGGFCQRCVGHTVPAVPPHSAHPVQAAVCQKSSQGIYLCGVDHAGPRPLVAGGKGEIPDDRHPDTGFQRQDVIFVFQQHGTFGGGTADTRRTKPLLKTASTSCRAESMPGLGISRSEPLRTPSTWSLEPPQSVMTKPS